MASSKPGAIHSKRCPRNAWQKSRTSLISCVRAVTHSNSRAPQPRPRSPPSRKSGITLTMPPTAGYSFGDVLLVPFPFTDQVGTKKRPAVVISSAGYNSAQRDLVIMAVTSQLRPSGALGEALGGQLAGRRSAQTLGHQTRHHYHRADTRYPSPWPAYDRGSAVTQKRHLQNRRLTADPGNGQDTAFSKPLTFHFCAEFSYPGNSRGAWRNQ